jgi:hypothetical protein
MSQWCVFSDAHTRMVRFTTGTVLVNQLVDAQRE